MLIAASSMDLPKMMCKDLKACLADDKVKAVFRFVQDNLHVLNRYGLFQTPTFGFLPSFY